MFQVSPLVSFSVCSTRDYTGLPELDEKFEGAAGVNRHGDDEFSCSFCDKRFSSRRFANVHVQGHNMM